MAGKVGRVVKAGAGYEGKQGPQYTPGISAESVGSERLWLGAVVIPPGGRTKAHLHEGHDTAFYVVSGADIELWSGDALQDRAVAQTGDYLYIPAGAAHVAVNRGDVPAVCVGARTDPNEQESVRLLPALDAAVP